MLSIKESFEKTFVREQRWKLIVEGICTTMIISLFSVLGGTLLGFALYMAARSKKKWLSKLAKGIAKVYSTIIEGTPTLVVLMLLFYVVFTSPDMSGIVVAIVGFILTFGSFVYDNLALTVSGVDNGQLEAAYALGYSRNRTFFRIILPLSKPVLATVALFMFLFQWNNWYTSMLYITDDRLNSLKYLLQRLLQDLNLIKEMQKHGLDMADAIDVPAETVRMAMAVMVMGPALFVFPFFQKYFVKGVTVGSVKG